MIRQGQIFIFSIFPLFLLVLNLLLKSIYLTSQDIGLDEPFTIYHAQFGFGTIIEHLKNYNNPPLFELILHVWIKWFGISPIAVRILPLIFASLSPVALYLFARKRFSQTVAVNSSLLLSFSSMLVYFAHDCRVYSLFLLLSIISMNYFLDLIEGKVKSMAAMTGFVAASVLLIYSHYFGFFILLFQAIYLLLFFRDRLLKFTIYYFLVLLLYTPHLYVLFQRFGQSVKHGTWLKEPSGIESLYNMLWSFSNFPFIVVFCIILLFIGLMVGVKNISFSGRNKPLLLIFLWFVIPFFGMFFISYWVPMYISRYLIFVLPAYYILISYCIETLFKNLLIRNIVFVALILSFGFTMEFDPDKKQNVEESVTVIKNLKDDSTLVVVSPTDFRIPFSYYYNRDYFKAITDNKEYKLTDSLLKQDNVLTLNSINDLKWSNLSKYNKIICLSNVKNLAPDQKTIAPNFIFSTKLVLHHRYYISIFNK